MRRRGGVGDREGEEEARGLHRPRVRNPKRLAARKRRGARATAGSRASDDAASSHAFFADEADVPAGLKETSSKGSPKESSRGVGIIANERSLL